MAQLKKDSKVTYNKSGSGSISARINIPKDWLEAIGVSPEDREIEILFGYGNILIKKKAKDPSSLNT